MYGKWSLRLACRPSICLAVIRAEIYSTVCKSCIHSKHWKYYTVNTLQALKILYGEYITSIEDTLRLIHYKHWRYYTVNTLLALKILYGEYITSIEDTTVYGEYITSMEETIRWIHYSRARYITAQCTQNRQSTVLQGWEYALSLFALLLKIALFKEQARAIRSPCSLKKSDKSESLSSLFKKEWYDWFILKKRRRKK